MRWETPDAHSDPRVDEVDAERAVSQKRWAIPYMLNSLSRCQLAAFLIAR